MLFERGVHVVAFFIFFSEWRREHHSKDCAHQAQQFNNTSQSIIAQSHSIFITCYLIICLGNGPFTNSTSIHHKDPIQSSDNVASTQTFSSILFLFLVPFESTFFTPNMNPMRPLILVSSLAMLMAVQTASAAMSTACQNPVVLTSLQGTITDHNSTESPKYANNQYCVWTINSTDVGIRFLLTFNHFDLGSWSSDSLTVFDGDSVNAPALRTITGRSTPPPVASTSNSITLFFKSGSYGQYAGFGLSYRDILLGDIVTVEDAMDPACRNPATLTSPTGSITDHSYRQDWPYYAPYSDCIWIVNATGAESIVLNFLTFDLGSSTDDSLTIYDGDSINAPALRVLTGRSVPSAVVSSQPAITIQFKTNSHSQFQGFSLNYRNVSLDAVVADTRAMDAACTSPVVLTNMTGMITDHHYRDEFPNFAPSSSCVWTIKNNLAESWLLSFSSFDGGVLSIYDGDSVKSPLLDRYSGSSAGPIASSQSSITLKFETSASLTTRKGFVLNYRNVSLTDPVTNERAMDSACQTPVVLTALNGTITDHVNREEFPNYSNGQTCIWTTHALNESDTVLLEFPLLSIGFFDDLDIFDGPSTTSPRLQNIANTVSSNSFKIASTQRSITLRLKTSSIFSTRGGFIVNFSNVAPDAVVTNQRAMSQACTAPQVLTKAMARAVSQIIIIMICIRTMRQCKLAPGSFSHTKPNQFSFLSVKGWV